jgi:MFS transporter, UMF1 family
LPEKQSEIQSYIGAIKYIAMLFYLVGILILGNLLGTDDVETGRLAVFVSSVICIPLFTICWKYLFHDRPALSRMAPNHSLLTAGFYRVYKTSQTIHSHLPGAKWLLRSICFSEAADSALPTVATTYMNEELGMNALEIGLVMLVVLIAGMPGSYLGKFLAIRYNPVASAKASLIWYISVTTIASLTLKRSTKNLTYIFGALWGISQGMMHPQHAASFVTLSPRGQEAELMGTFLFACNLLQFLPPMLFTILNEAGVDMNIGLASLTLFFGTGYYGLSRIGDYDSAIEHVKNLPENVDVGGIGVEVYQRGTTEVEATNIESAYGYIYDPDDRFEDEE